MEAGEVLRRICRVGACNNTRFTTIQRRRHHQPVGVNPQKDNVFQ